MARYVAYDTVHAIATEQHGLLKATQATAAGVAPKSLVAMAARGRLERIGHGLYRDLLGSLLDEQSLSLHQDDADPLSGARRIRPFLATQATA